MFHIVVRDLKTASFAILAIMSSICVLQLYSLFDIHFAPRGQDVFDLFDAILAFAVVLTIYGMPLRNPRLSDYGISTSLDQPSNDLRSPEDNLTLWQFMTVSWMSPLISLGSTRQLNEEDVWLLGHEFQHRPLYDRFIELKGSVPRRILAANKIDLIITSSLAVFESIASRYIGPLLLPSSARALFVRAFCPCLEQ